MREQQGGEDGSLSAHRCQEMGIQGLGCTRSLDLDTLSGEGRSGATRACPVNGKLSQGR